MRVSAALLTLALAAPLRPAVLAERAQVAIGDRGSDAIRGGPLPVCRFELRFTLDGPALVWAEAEGLQGRRPGGHGAPEAFLGGHYLGGLRAEHGAHWRSPRAVPLGAGEHSLELRCPDVKDADDVSIRRLRVLRQGPGPAPAPSRSKAGSAQALRARPRAACQDLQAGKAWPARLGAGGLTLSVLSGRSASAGVMARLAPGQAWAGLARIPKAADGGALPLAASLEPAQADGSVRLRFFLDPSGRLAPRHEAVGYRPGAWEPLRLEYCQGRVQATFARTGTLQQPHQGPWAEFEILAQDLELGLKPAP